jgi:alpha-beta hydrolase superfamily lysophospholipase
MRQVLMSLLLTTLLASAGAVPIAVDAAQTTNGTMASSGETIPTVHYRSTTIDGVDVFYREAGLANGPVVLLLRGFPTSSHMFRNLIPLLADKYRVIAPDYPGYGQSDAPDHDKFAYTFANQADIVDKLVTTLGPTDTLCM